MPNTKQKCLQLSILNCLAEILPSANWKEGRMPQKQSPVVRVPLKSRQQGTLQYLRAQLVKSRVSTVWKITCPAAICLFFSILNPALLQSSQYIHLIPQKCWCCQAIMYTNIAKGSIIQYDLPEAIHPRQTGKLPITDPTIVFHSDLVFILVYTNRYPPQMTAPKAADIGLQLYNPNIPTRPSPTPLIRAYLGLRPNTRGRWHVRCIFLSYSTSMY